MANKMLCFLVIISISTLLLAERPQNELPMYGGQHQPEVEKNKEYSESAVKLGWQYFYKGDIDTAIKRFNQAWMFDPENAEAYWGFGVVMGRRASEGNPMKNLQESIKYLEIAYKKLPKNAHLMVDLAHAHASLGGGFARDEPTKAQPEWETARKLFEEAEKIEPTYSLLYANWSMLNFYVADYTAAQNHLDKAKELGFKPDPDYVQALEGKLGK